MDKTLGKKLVIIAVILITALIMVKSSSAVEEARDGDFIASDDGTVWDQRTNLLWAAKDNGENVSWQDAKDYCDNYNGGGYSGWRMPTKDELKGLYDRSIFGNNGFHLTKLIKLTGGFLWTSEIQGSQATVVNFLYDRDMWFGESLTHKSRNRVLPVRLGKERNVAVGEQKNKEVVSPPPPPPAPEPQPAPEPPPPPVKEKVSIALNLEFDTAKSVIKKKYHDNIKQVADFMQKYPDTNVVIEGHTDNVDRYNDPENNIKLSQARADSVRQYLVDKFGIDKSRINAVGYGPDRPIADNNTEEGRKKNRRVDAVIETIVIK
jgi:outer membrane protein OmpA-like peptidoglycan-associated protein